MQKLHKCEASSLLDALYTGLLRSPKMVIIFTKSNIIGERSEPTLSTNFTIIIVLTGDTIRPRLSLSAHNSVRVSFEPRKVRSESLVYFLT